MSEKKRLLRKTLLIPAGIIVGLFILIIVFISPIVKYIVEKYDEKYTGRQITMDRAYVNLLTDYIHFANFKFHEYKSDSVFVSCSGISAHLDFWTLLSKEYEIKDITFDKPWIIVIQHERTNLILRTW
jgi:hypothetical protein